ncbi:MAG: acetate--CoA ligase family protein [Candidatus Heimdallarchaeota archaeon]|nr:acetate--CoA ligase family protein [Candidatus Heimdallarchaeota archaeon]MCK5048328.1 acetate--CoA ligase family protein [Candidatus Heimdallarchaeota archaeon]
MSIASIISQAYEDGRTILTLTESRDVLSLSNLPLNVSEFATSLDKALEIADSCGYPVVMKIVSKDITHKTDVGGVRLNIASSDDLKEEYNDMMSSITSQFPDANIEGVVIEEMLSGNELIIGSSTDPSFGPMIAFGLGGIFVEIYKDIAFKLVPISRQDAHELIHEIKGSKILQGYRGSPAVDEEVLIDCLIAVSDLLVANPEIDELDINPLIITDKGIKAIDARVILKTK